MWAIGLVGLVFGIAGSGRVPEVRELSAASAFAAPDRAISRSRAVPDLADEADPGSGAGTGAAAASPPVAISGSALRRDGSLPPRPDDTWPAATADRGAALGGIPRPLPASGEPHQTFWAWDFHAREFYSLWADAVYGSANLVIYIEEGQSVPGPVIRKLAMAFEGDIYPKLRAAYGPEPDPGIDGSSAVALLLLDIRDARFHDRGGESYIGGYFDAINEYRQADVGDKKSNEREMFYIDVGAPTDLASPALLQNVAHEFTHLITWNHDREEEEWFSEGLSELAVFLSGLGHPEQHVRAFLANPQASLTYWGGIPRDYGKVYLYMLYLYDRFGAANPTWLRRLVAESSDGLENVAAVLPPGARAAEVFRDFALAVYWNEPSFGGGRWAFRSIALGQPGGYPRARPVAHPADTFVAEDFVLGGWMARADTFVVSRKPATIAVGANVPDDICVAAGWTTSPEAAAGFVNQAGSTCLTTRPEAEWSFAVPGGGRTTVQTVIVNTADRRAGGHVRSEARLGGLVVGTVWLPVVLRR